MSEEELGPLGGSVVGAIGIAVGLLVVLPTALAERRIDLNDRCRTTESGKCFSHHTGIVESFDSEGVKVLYDDGRKTATVHVVGETVPGPRTRVRLERWNGDIVSIYDPADDRRYRTIRWPDADSSGGWVLVVFGVLILVVSLGTAVPQAARSNGKPWRSRSRSKSRR